MQAGTDMREIELSAGTIEYQDVGEGPALVLAEIADSYTLVPLDQPARLAGLIGEFTAEAA